MYGTYDVGQDAAVVNVGISHDTAEFAVESIRRWWRLMGRRTYPAARRLLISADAGGSNGPRLRAWKVHLQDLADELRRPITVCHYPPGTSKWNKIEHRLFSFISLNWKGQPLISYEAIVNLIGGTRTRSGLKVKAVLDTRAYQTGRTVTDEEVHALHIKAHSYFIFSRALIVHDQMQIEDGHDLGVDFLEESEKFLMPMAWHTVADDLAVEHAEGFSMKCLSRLSLKVSPRCGWRLWRFQIRWTVAWLSLWARAIVRVLQCVAAGGVVCNVVEAAVM